jgi:integrase
MTALRAAHIDFDSEVLIVIEGKDRRSRSVPFGSKTGMAFVRYRRTRLSHPQALSHGSKGALTDSGVTRMLWRRRVDADVGHVHPHQLRHTAVHAFLAAGGSETDAMRIFGWKSRHMVNRYGAAAADDRVARSIQTAFAGGSALRDGTHGRAPTNALRGDAGDHGGARESHLLRRSKS